jgi:tRNA 2-thiouridine synthesizing protein A
MTDFNIDKEVDLSGMNCPIPLVSLGHEIVALPVGGILRAVTTDPACVSDVVAWASTTGHELLETQHSGQEYAFLIRRTH